MKTRREYTDEVVHLTLDCGLTTHQVAARLGLKSDVVGWVKWQARKKGLLPRKLSYTHRLRLHRLRLGTMGDIMERLEPDDHARLCHLAKSADTETLAPIIAYLIKKGLKK